MVVTVISASIMMSVRNITNIFFPVRRDREMSFPGSSIFNEIIPIPFLFSPFMIFVDGLPWCYGGMKLTETNFHHALRSYGQVVFFAPFYIRSTGKKHRRTSRLSFRSTMAGYGKHFVLHVFCRIHVGN